MEQFKKKRTLEERIENQILRIAEIDLKIKKLNEARQELLKQLGKNQRILEEGKTPTPKKQIRITEEYRESLIKQSKSFL